MRPLSATGQADADRVAEILARESPVAIYSSPYRRARQTVEPLSSRLGLPIQEMSELRERSLLAHRDENWLSAIRSTWEDFSFAHPDGAETNDDALARAAAAFETLLHRHRGQTIVVATHGNLLVLFLRLLDPAKGYDFWRTLTFPDIYRLEVELNNSFRLRRLWEDQGSS